MPRKENSEVRLYCLKCKDFTQSIGPIIISKLIKNIYHIKARCSICNKFKSKFLNHEQINLLPDEIKNSPENSTFNNDIIRDGKALPPLALIPLVIAGISALTSTASTAASVVLANKQANETERHNKQIEQIASQGNGISNEVIKRDEHKVLSDTALPVKKLITDEKARMLSDDELIKQSMNFLRGKGFIICI